MFLQHRKVFTRQTSYQIECGDWVPAPERAVHVGLGISQPEESCHDKEIDPRAGISLNVQDEVVSVAKRDSDDDNEAWESVEYKSAGVSEIGCVSGYSLGIQWSSRPAPGAPLGQLEAQNFGNGITPSLANS